MSGFSPDWLALREPADIRARNADVASALAARFALRDSVSVVDLGCGTGSNLRTTSALLPSRQSWTLVDYDSRLLDAARGVLASWADTSTANDDGSMSLTKDSRAITVRFRQADLVADLEAMLDPAPDLVTAAALFDLASPEFIRRTARAVARTGAVFYTVLTYNGIQHWHPRTPSDGQMTSAFNRHQMTDKGFGVSAGPTAPVHLAEQFEVMGFAVTEGQSPWIMSAPRDAQLIGELVQGQAAAVRETRAVDAATVERWLKVARTGAEVGHVDTLAVPPPGGIAGMND
ncbi:MAG: class I SAM-dependent methyltransferase [Hyphomicrobiaceae bacterium]